MIRIIIVDDNLFIQKAIAEKLSFFNDLSCKYTAENGADLLEKLEHNHNIHLILMDIEMPKMNGIQATALVKSKYPQIKVIMLTTFDNDENIFLSIKAGADGYLLKDIHPENLHNGILETMDGGATMTPSIAFKTLRLLRNPACVAVEQDEAVRLTTRETEVLEQLSRGLTYNTIADNLDISVGTARKHVEHIYAKLQVHNKLEAIEKARFNKLI